MKDPTPEQLELRAKLIKVTKEQLDDAVEGNRPEPTVDPWWVRLPIWLLEQRMKQRICRERWTDDK